MTISRHQSKKVSSRSAGASSSHLKSILLCGGAGIILPLFSAAHAQDVTITEILTDPLSTSTADNGNPANVIFDTSGGVTVDSGTAVTVDSDNDLTQNGVITVNGSNDTTADNSIGVQLNAGVTGNYTQSGSIIMDRTAEQEAATENDGVPDYNDNRAAILLQDGGVFTGDIMLAGASAITVFGDMSAGVRMLGDLDGNAMLDGNFTIRGQNSQAVAISGNVTGDVIFGPSASVDVDGQGSTGILVDGSIDGAFVFGGTAAVTGYTDLIPDPADAEDNDNATQITQLSGPAIDIAGNVGGGILIDGPVPDGQLAEAGEGEDPIVNPPTASITSLSSAPGVRITGGATIGAVDTSGLVDPGAYGTFGFINRGIITGQAVYDLDSLAVLIENATITGGMRNDGSIRAVGINGDATGLLINNGSSVPSLFNGGLIESTTFGTTDMVADAHTAYGVRIQDTSTVSSFTNTGIVNVVNTSDNGDAVAILDESGSVTTVTNQAVIAARIVDDASEGNETNTPTGQAIAFDFSANTTGVTITNTVGDDFDGSAADRATLGVVLGDVILGSGDDSYIADAGSTAGDLFLGGGNDTVDLSQAASITGNIAFDNGDDTLMVANGSITGDLTFGAGTDALFFSDSTTFTGAVTDSDSDLSISLMSGSTLNFSNASALGTQTLGLSSLTVDDGSTLGIAIDDFGAGATQINVAGTAFFGTDAKIRPIFLGSVPQTDLTGDNAIEIISAGTLTVQDISTLLDTNDIPFLFDFGVGLDAANPNIIELSISTKSPDELGIANGLQSALNPTVAALNLDTDLGPQIFNLTTQEDFQSAFGQLIAGPLDAPLAYARAQTNSVTSIITQRLDMARNSGDYGRTFWLQEETYFVNRDEDAASNGFDGGGFVIAAGVDAGLDNGIDAIGLSASFSSARYDEQTGEDFPFNRVTYGIGAYGAATFGKLQVDARAEYSISDSDSERNVVIGNSRRRAVGEWEGTQIAASGRVSYETKVADFTVEPFASVDYLSLEEDAYTETGGQDPNGTPGNQGINLIVADREADSIRTNLGVKAGKVYELQPSAFDTGIPGTLHPQFTVAWSQELNTDDIEATYTYASGGDSFTLLSEPEDGAAIVGADIAYENEYAKVHIGASGTFGDTTEVYVLRAGVGLKW